MSSRSKGHQKIVLLIISPGLVSKLAHKNLSHQPKNGKRLVYVTHQSTTLCSTSFARDAKSGFIMSPPAPVCLRGQLEKFPLSNALAAESAKGEHCSKHQPIQMKKKNDECMVIEFEYYVKILFSKLKKYNKYLQIIDWRWSMNFRNHYQQFFIYVEDAYIELQKKLLFYFYLLSTLSSY